MIRTPGAHDARVRRPSCAPRAAFYPAQLAAGARPATAQRGPELRAQAPDRECCPGPGVRRREPRRMHTAERVRAIREVRSRCAWSRRAPLARALGKEGKDRGDKGATTCVHGPEWLRDLGDHAAARVPPSPCRSDRRVLGVNRLRSALRWRHVGPVRPQPERELQRARRALVLRRPGHGLVPRRDRRTVRDQQRDHPRRRSLRGAGERERRPLARSALATDLRPTVLRPGARPGSRGKRTARPVWPVPLRSPRHCDRLRRPPRRSSPPPTAFGRADKASPARSCAWPGLPGSGWCRPWPCGRWRGKP